VTDSVVPDGVITGSMAKDLFAHGRPITHDQFGVLGANGVRAAMCEPTSVPGGDDHRPDVGVESLDLSSDVHQQKHSRFRRRGLAFLPYRSRVLAGTPAGPPSVAPPACRTPGQKNRKAAGPEGPWSGLVCENSLYEDKWGLNARWRCIIKRWIWIAPMIESASTPHIRHSGHYFHRTLLHRSNSGDICVNDAPKLTP